MDRCHESFEPYRFRVDHVFLERLQLRRHRGDRDVVDERNSRRGELLVRSSGICGQQVGERQLVRDDRENDQELRDELQLVVSATHGRH